MPSARIIFFCILACLLLPAHAQPVEDSVFLLKTVEITGDRMFEKQSAGMKRSSIDTLVIIRGAHLDLADLLSENTPVFIKSLGRGALATASFRGTAPSHTTVRWNGMEINSPMNGMVDFSLIPVYLLDEVELKFGAASLGEGSGGMGGSINIGNTVDWENTFGVKYLQGIGSYRTFDEFLQVQAGNSRIQSKTRIYHNYSANDYTFVNRGIAEIDPVTGAVTNPVDTNSNAAFKRYGLLQEFYYRAGGRHVVSARWWIQEAERTIPRATSYEGPDHSNLNRQTDLDNRLSLDWKSHGRKHRMTLRTGYTGKKLNYWLKNHVGGLGEVPVIYSTGKQNSFLNKLSFDYHFRGDLSLEASLDADYHHVATRDTVAGAGYDKDRIANSLFVAVRKSFFGRLNLNIMLRQDLIDFRAVAPVPYIGLDYRPLPGKAWVVRTHIARNYHYPSLNDLYWEPGGNPDLQAEKGHSAELGTEYSHSFGSHLLFAGATGFYSRIRDWIIWLPDYKGYWIPLNISLVETKGLEAEIRVQGSLGKVGYRVAATYACTDSRNFGDPRVWGDESYGKQLVYVPRHSGNLMLNLSWHGFYATYRHNSYSERFTTSGNDFSRRDWLYPYFMNDLLAGKSFRVKKLDMAVEFTVYNLFDETYHTVLYRPMPGRNYLLTLMIRY
jgi:iron complex outermembrane receptor protein